MLERKSPDQIDLLARQAVQNASDCHITEQEARDEIGAMLYHSDIAIEVARGYSRDTKSAQFIEDLADDLRLFIWEKARGLTNARSGGWTGESSSTLDLETVRTRSVSAWARELMKARCWFFEQKWIRKSGHEAVLADAEYTVADIIDESQAHVDDVDPDMSDIVDAVIESYARTVRARRSDTENNEVHARSRAVERFYGVVSPVRLDDSVSDRVLDLMNADPKWAQNEVRNLVDCMDAGEDPILYGVHPAVLETFGGMSPEMLEALNRDARTADAMLRSAATPTSPLSYKMERELRRLVNMKAGRTRPVSDMMNAYVTMIAECDESGARKKQAVRREERDEFRKCALLLLDKGIDDLGDSVEAIEGSLGAMMTSLEAQSLGVPVTFPTVESSPGL